MASLGIAILKVEMVDKCSEVFGIPGKMTFSMSMGQLGPGT